jgi:hypothetical protein
MYTLFKTLPAYFIITDPIRRRGAEEQEMGCIKDKRW